MTTPNPSNPSSRRRPGAGWILALALAPFASCGGEASEPEPAAAPAPVTRSATPEDAETPAGGASESKLERAARESREALDRLEEAVDRLTPDQRLEFDDPIAQLEERRDAALSAAEEATAAAAKAGRLRKLVRELGRIATEAGALAEKAEDVAADAT
jgi:TolA-binding protein